MILKFIGYVGISKLSKKISGVQSIQSNGGGLLCGYLFCGVMVTRE